MEKNDRVVVTGVEGNDLSAIVTNGRVRDLGGSTEGAGDGMTLCFGDVLGEGASVDENARTSIAYRTAGRRSVVAHEGRRLDRPNRAQEKLDRTRALLIRPGGVAGRLICRVVRERTRLDVQDSTLISNQCPSAAVGMVLCK